VHRSVAPPRILYRVAKQAPDGEGLMYIARMLAGARQAFIDAGGETLLGVT
jgi:hypothetical protein